MRKHATALLAFSMAALWLGTAMSADDTTSQSEIKDPATNQIDQPRGGETRTGDYMGDMNGKERTRGARAGTSISALNPDQVISGWSETSKAAARRMIDKYGQPQEVTSNMLVWRDNGSFRKTVVSREEVQHLFPRQHFDVLSQSVSYKVPPDKFDDLALFDGSITADRTKGTLTSRCDSEEHNILALNLAHDVITGKKSVEEARSYLGRAAALEMSGKSDPYIEKLQFKTMSEKEAVDHDQPVSETVPE